MLALWGFHTEGAAQSIFFLTLIGIFVYIGLTDYGDDE